MARPASHTYRSALALAGILAAVMLSGCGYTAKPLIDSPRDPPQLRTIRKAFEALVEKAWHDPDINWHTGGVGNIVVNVVGGDNRGLCYQWQDYLYSGLLPTVQKAGWCATGIAANENFEHEHHCVMVWDPKRIREDEILKRPRPEPVYVLDVWRTGHPNVYWLDDWLDGEAPHECPPRVQKLPEPMIPLPTPGRWEDPKPNADRK